VRPDLPPELWTAAGTPVGAHALASAACDPDDYAYVRGVAQQAARLARATGLSREARALVLACAWLSWSGPGATSRTRTLDGPQALRRAGHDDLARVLAWAGAAADLRGGDIAADAEAFPLPSGDGARALILLDVALVTTDAAGAAAPPALVLRGLAERRGASDASVAAFVGLVADLADHPEARVLVEAVSPQQAAAGR
jgi:hypothetical protein